MGRRRGEAERAAGGEGGVDGEARVGVGNPKAKTESRVRVDGVEQRNALRHVGGQASLILVLQEGLQGEASQIRREEAREAPADLIVDRAVPHEVAGRVWEATRTAGQA